MQTSSETSAPPRLSVCLPVYNFGAFLGQTLDSILPQAETHEGVEVIVVDGASTDDTQAVVAARQARHPRLRYVRLDRKGGIDADMARSVELATGRYCWLFSGDDIMRPGAIESVLRWTESDCDLYICRHANCDLHMRHLGDHPVFRDDVVRTADLADAGQRLAYLQAAATTEALFSFMSGLILRRDTWLSVPAVEEFMGSCWGHVARLLSLCERRLTVCYMAEILLDKRGDNDSFMQRGLVHRLGIGVWGFARLAERFFGAGTTETLEVIRLLRTEVGIGYLLYARIKVAEAPERESMAELDRIAVLLHGGAGWRRRLSLYAYRHTPLPVARLLGAVHFALLDWRARIFGRREAGGR